MAGLVFPLLFIALSGGLAQTPPPRPAPPTAAAVDPAFEASKNAFEALPEADRKSVQDALVWAGTYHGVVDGTFGKGTRDALIAFETREKLHADAIVDAGEMARLLAAAKKVKDAARFTVVTDPVSGIRLGLPLKTLVKHAASHTGTKYTSADASVAVETRFVQDDADLAKLYERLKADTPDRKVTYKATRGDWFVVSGEGGETHFYTRYAKGSAADGNELRGYTLTYPVAVAAEFDRISVAIANSFEPFAGAAPVADAGDAGKKSTATPVIPTAPAAPPKLRFTATGVAVAPGRLVTMLPSVCADPATGKQKLNIIKSEADSGLTLLEFAQAPATSLTIGAGDLANSTPLVIVGFVAGKPAPSLDVTAGDALVHPNSEGKAALRVLAPLQADASGSPVFDRSGALRGLIAREPQKPRVVAGIVPLASHAVLGTVDLTQFLTAANVSIPPASGPGSQTLTAGEIAAAARAALVPIDCLR